MQTFYKILVSDIKAEKRLIGDIIDDRSMNHIPFMPYVGEYKKLDVVQKYIEESYCNQPAVSKENYGRLHI